MAVVGGVWNGAVGIRDGLRGGIGTMGLKENMGELGRGYGSFRRKRTKQPWRNARPATC